MSGVSLPSRPHLLRAFAVLIPLGVVANVGLALKSTDRHLLASLDGSAVAPLLIAGGLALFPWLTQSLRIAIWTRFVGHPVTVLAGLRIAAGSVLGSALTPTAVGGGSIRWALATRHGVPPGTAASLLAVEAVEDVTFFAVALPVAALFSAPSEAVALRRAMTSPALHLDDPVVLAVGVMVGLAVATAWIGHQAARGRLGGHLRRWARRALARLRRPVRSFRADLRQTAVLVATRGKRWFALSLACTSLQWVARYSVATVLVAMLDGPFRPFLFWTLGWMTYAVSSAVPTPGAAGAAEATFLLLHKPFLPASMLVLTTALWRLLMFYAPALVAAVVYPALGVVLRRTSPR